MNKRLLLYHIISLHFDFVPNRDGEVHRVIASKLAKTAASTDKRVYQRPPVPVPVSAGICSDVQTVNYVETRTRSVFIVW